jgi:hypothetical protein
MCEKKIGFVFLLLLVPAAVFAARPLSTDDAGVVDRGSYEVELGYDFLNDDADVESRSMGLSIKHGLTERFDFGIGIPYRIEPDDGLSNIEFAMKLALFSLKSLAGSFVLNYAPGESEYRVVGILSAEAGPVVTHINLGCTTVPDSEEENGLTAYAVAVEWPVSGKITLVSEVTGELGSGDGEDPVEAILGVSFMAFDAASFDFGIGGGLNEESPEIKFTLGLTYGF